MSFRRSTNLIFNERPVKKVNRRVWLLAALLFISAALFFGLTIQNNKSIGLTAQRVDNSQSVLKQISEIRTTLFQSEIAFDTYLADQNLISARDIFDFHKRLSTQLSALSSLTKNNSTLKDINSLQSFLQRKQNLETDIAEQLSKANKNAQSGEKWEAIINVNKSIGIVLDTISQEERNFLKKEIAQDEETRLKNFYITLIGGGFALCTLLVVLFKIIKENKRRLFAEEYAKKNEIKYKKLVEESSVVMYTANTLGNFTYASTKCLDLTGYSSEELTGMHFTQMIHTDWVEFVANQYIHQFKNNISETTLEFPIITKHHEVKWVEQYAALTYEDYEISGFQCVINDITQKKHADEEIRSANEKIAAMLASTQDGFFMLGKDHSLTMINEAGKKLVKMLTGKNCSLGDNMVYYIPEERREDFKEIINKVLTGETEESETKIVTPEGDKWVHNSYFPVYDKGNKIIGICASSKDITQRKITESEIEKIWIEKEEYRFLLQSILDNTPVSIFVKDLQGRYMVVNRSFRELLKLPEEKIIGYTDFDFADKKDAERYKKADEQVITSLQCIETEETIVHENGKQHLLILKFPLFDKDHKPCGVGAIATDITERTLYQQKILEAKRKAEKAEHLQEQFLANMSHEIRTPLNGIIGMTTLLLKTYLNEEQKEFTHFISQSSENLLVLLNDILDLSKIKAGKIAIESIPFKFKETLDHVFNTFRIKAEQKNLELNMDYDPSIPQMFIGDPYRLTQIISNLLSNAVKFTDHGFIKFSAKQIQQKEKTVTVELSLADSGIGIPQNKLDLIFESFQQAGIDIARKFGGSGLGLSITKQLVELQKGKIAVTSKENQGTTFIITLNYAVHTNTNKVEETNTAVAKNASAISFAGKRVLITEDNFINQKVLFNLLEKWNMQIETANNGKEAIKILQQDSNFDFILMDIQMPEMDGFQTAAFIRSKLALNIPIIAMTASTMRNEKTKCIALGINDYITKPFSFVKLSECMQRLLMEKKQSISKPAIDVPTETSSNTYYSLRYLDEMDDKEYSCELLEMFLKDMPAMLKEIREAVFCEDWDIVYKKAHKLKSSVGLLQMQQLLEMLTQLEFKALKRTELATIKTDLDNVIELYRIINPMIEAELQNIKTVTV